MPALPHVLLVQAARIHQTLQHREDRDARDDRRRDECRDPGEGERDGLPGGDARVEPLLEDVVGDRGDLDRRARDDERAGRDPRGDDEPDEDRDLHCGLSPSGSDRSSLSLDGRSWNAAPEARSAVSEAGPHHLRGARGADLRGLVPDHRAHRDPRPAPLNGLAGVRHGRARRTRRRSAPYRFSSM